MYGKIWLDVASDEVDRYLDAAYVCTTSVPAAIAIVREQN